MRSDGVSNNQLKAQTGHKQDATLDKYDRTKQRNIFKGVGNVLGNPKEKK